MPKGQCEINGVPACIHFMPPEDCMNGECIFQSVDSVQTPPARIREPEATEVTPGEKTDDAKPQVAHESEAVKKAPKCSHKNKKGKQCSRAPLAGAECCWQHNK